MHPLTKTLQFWSYSGNEGGQTPAQAPVYVYAGGGHRKQQVQHQGQGGLHKATEHGPSRVRNQRQSMQRPHLQWQFRGQMRVQGGVGVGGGLQWAPQNYGIWVLHSLQSTLASVKSTPKRYFRGQMRGLRLGLGWSVGFIVGSTKLRNIGPSESAINASPCRDNTQNLMVGLELGLIVSSTKLQNMRQPQYDVIANKGFGAGAGDQGWSRGLSGELYMVIITN